MASDILYKSKDYALADFCPCYMKDSNAKFDICDKTFYFSVATSLKNTNKKTERSRLTEHEKLT